MKILLVPSTNLPIPPINGGAVQNLIYEYIKNNEKEDFDDIKLVTISDKSNMSKEGFEHTDIICVKIPHWIFKVRNYFKKPFSSFAFKYVEYRYLNAVKREMKKDKERVVVFENTPGIVRKLEKAPGSKWVLHIYNDFLSKPECEYEIKKVDKIIACSGYIKNQVYCEQDKSEVVYNGICTDKFSGMNKEYGNVRNEVRRELNISDDEIVIITVARLVPEKGVKELIEAFKKVTTNKKVKLVIVGNKLYGENVTDDYQREIKELSLERQEDIIFTGYISYNELYKYYWASDIGVLATLYDEPFSMAAIEYMASGLIPIFTKSGGFPEMIQEPELLVDRKNLVENLKNTLETVIENIENYKQNNNYMQLAKKYSIDEYCNNKKIILRGLDKK